MKMFQMFVTIFKCFVRNQSPWNGADDKMRSRSIIQKSPYVHLSEEHVQNTSNSTFHLFKKKNKNKKTQSLTALVRFDPTLIMYSFSVLQPTLSNINNKAIHSNKTFSNSGSK